MSSKWSDERAKQVKEWMGRKTKCSFPGHSADDFAKALNDGVILCQLANAIKPGSIKKFHEKAKMPFFKMENIGWFCDFVRSQGVKSEYTFVTVDLYEEQNMPQVLICLASLKDATS